MKKSILAGSLALVFGVASACAHADTIFELTHSTCSSGCNVLPAGTVDLSQVTTNEVEVTVTLTSDYSFRQAPDSNHWALVFDLSGVSGSVTASNITSGPTSQTFALQSPGSYTDAGLGSFTYAFKCTTCAKGATGTPTQTLSFLLTGTGLTEASFVSNGSYSFGVDVVGLDQAAGSGTGNIGAPGPGTPGDPGPTPVPEPSTLLFLGTGLTTLGGLVRVRMAPARSRQ
ncbi:PEP-CTERM sorting domain-containing protein [Edaphobacter bradus]|uniref:PEP-CTERM sorting domain-containing protein n=1 Tax=Edaphobacter bradus TaxID=2259016 RepID=UPI0021E01130|nr:PEP-CTERM sorting domain-containing protein [Edaphobacter bradus]